MTALTRATWATMNPAGAGKIGLHDARAALGSGYAPGSTAVNKRAGMLPHSVTPGAVTATTPTPNNNVHVAPFQLVLPSSRATAGAVAAPPYIITSDRTLTYNAFATPPSVSADRRDLIVMQQNDLDQSDANSDPDLRYVVGNAPASDPAITGSPDYVIVAQVTVRQSATSVLQSDIVSRLPAAYTTVAVGGILPVGSAAQRDAITTPYDGFAVWRTDRGWAEVRHSGGWRISGTPIVSTVAALATDITSPAAGQIAFVTATNLLYRYTGSAWVPVDVPYTHAYQSTPGIHAVPNLTATPIAFNAEIVDNMGAHANASNNTRITPTVPGKYRVRGMVAMDPSSTGACYAHIRKNGASDTGGPYKGGWGTSNAFASFGFDCDATIDCNGTTDYVELWFHHAFGVSKNTFVSTLAGANTVSFMVAERMTA
jgi:hypothetical protein